ncbi:MAG: hypothetical protein HYY86_01600 [Candidatus Harrisonbacteria bacterium]|nr:hypothetical protein [Candidatus Harrisonbacteria bacterium]
MEKSGLVAEKTCQKFFPILQKALAIGLESNLLKESFDCKLLHSEALQGFYFREPKNPDAETVSLKHPAQTNGKDLLNDLFFPITADEAPLLIKFQTLPDSLQPFYQRINLQAFSHHLDVLGLVCGRFGETKPFIIQNKTEIPHPDRDGLKDVPDTIIVKNPFVNLDCYSKTKEWNPLFVKYRLASPLENLRIGYLKIEVSKASDGAITVTVSRISEETVPEFLKTAQTFPK